LASFNVDGRVSHSRLQWQVGSVKDTRWKSR
jgi:hypothetical protein